MYSTAPTGPYTLYKGTMQDRHCAENRYRETLWSVSVEKVKTDVYRQSRESLGFFSHNSYNRDSYLVWSYFELLLFPVYATLYMERYILKGKDSFLLRLPDGECEFLLCRIYFCLFIY